MIIGIGCDLVQVERLKKSLSKEAFKNKVYTGKEIAYCEARGAHCAESYAARFAAKEALAKALGTGFRGGSLPEIEVVNDELGQPRIELTGEFARLAATRGCKKIFVSLSHTDNLAIAQIVLEG
jgi:holo-[acyl-carrier protein] synthase